MSMMIRRAKMRALEQQVAEEEVKKPKKAEKPEAEAKKPVAPKRGKKTKR